MSKADFLTKDFLQQEYITNNKSMQAIAESTGVTTTTVFRKLKSYGISKSKSDIQAARESTVKHKYGESVSNVSQSNEIKSKKRETAQTSFGVDYVFQANPVKSKIIAANTKIYDTPEDFIVKHQNKTTKEIADYYCCKPCAVRHYIINNNIDDSFLNKVNVSHYEDDISSILRNLGVENIKMRERGILDGQEIDIYLPDYKLGIEFNGDYWHCGKFVEPRYHQYKTKLAESKGIYLMHIFEKYWNEDQELVISKIKNYLTGNIQLQEATSDFIKVDLTYAEDKFYDSLYELVDFCDPEIIYYKGNYPVYNAGYKIYYAK